MRSHPSTTPSPHSTLDPYSPVFPRIPPKHSIQENSLALPRVGQENTHEKEFVLDELLLLRNTLEN